MVSQGARRGYARCDDFGRSEGTPSEHEEIPRRSCQYDRRAAASSMVCVWLFTAAGAGPTECPEQ
jgi:hypothetical protein